MCLCTILKLNRQLSIFHQGNVKLGNGYWESTFPKDVIEDLKGIAPQLGFSGYQPLIRAYIGSKQQQEIIHVGQLVIDTLKRTVSCKGQAIDLTAKEFELLTHFANNPGRVYSRTQLLDTVWGYGHDGYEHTVNSHMNRLRAKIEEDPSTPEYILTVWGVGYKFSENMINQEVG